MALSPRRAHPHEEPRLYPLMLRTWDYQSWRPFAGLAVVAGGLILVVPLVLLFVFAGIGAAWGHSFATEMKNIGDPKTVTPVAMLYLNLSLAAAIPLTWFALRTLHRMRPRWLASVKPGLRWKFFAGCFGLAIVAMFAQLVVGALLPSDSSAPASHAVHFDATTIGLILVVVFTTPLQALGEEYAFRGYLLMAIGSLTKRPWVAVLLGAVLFMLAHGTQNFPLMFDRFGFGLMAGYLVVRTGGLEPGMAMHILNNLVAFGIAIATGTLNSTLHVTHASNWQILLTIVPDGLYLLLVLWLAKRMGLRNVTAPPVVAISAVT